MAWVTDITGACAVAKRLTEEGRKAVRQDSHVRLNLRGFDVWVLVNLVLDADTVVAIMPPGAIKGLDGRLVHFTMDQILEIAEPSAAGAVNRE